uniref:Uncharacterized protein n=1 Tax=Arundo donax TaxID=35708 RepID=A0A0A8Y0X8_ARUDO
MLQRLANKKRTYAGSHNDKGSQVAERLDSIVVKHLKVCLPAILSCPMLRIGKKTSTADMLTLVFYAASLFYGLFAFFLLSGLLRMHGENRMKDMGREVFC